MVYLFFELQPEKRKRERGKERKRERVVLLSIAQS